MGPYEGVFILDPDCGLEGLKRITQFISEVIEKHGGRVTESQEWGKRKLAYRVKKKQEGNYLWVCFSSPQDALAKIQAQWRLHEPILKFLITRRDHVAAAEKRIPKSRMAKTAEVR